MAPSLVIVSQLTCHTHFFLFRDFKESLLQMVTLFAVQILLFLILRLCNSFPRSGSFFIAFAQHAFYVSSNSLGHSLPLLNPNISSLSPNQKPDFSLPGIGRKTSPSKQSGICPIPRFVPLEMSGWRFPKEKPGGRESENERKEVKALTSLDRRSSLLTSLLIFSTFER